MAALTQENITTARENSAIVPKMSPIAQEKSTIGLEMSPIAQENSTIGSEMSPIAQENSTIGSEMSPIAQENSAIGPERSTIAHENSAIGPDRSTISQENSAIGPERSPIAQENLVIGPDNSPILQENSIISPKKSPTAQENSVIASPNSPITPPANFPTGTEVSPISENMASIIDPILELKNSDIFGRYLVAKKYLPSGTLLFEESPLFVYSCFDQTIRKQGTSECINCYQQVPTKNIVICGKCQWGFCSWQCAWDPSHTELECKILRTKKILPDTADTIGCLYFLKFQILKKKERGKWEQVMSLVSKASDEKSQFARNRADLVLLAKKFLKRCGMNVHRSYLQEVTNIFQINSFSMNTEPNKVYSCLYGTCSLFANSCSPSAEWHHIVNRQERGVMGILTSQDIYTGEMVTISYSEDNMALGSRHRQMAMYRDYDFLCACPRCMDPSELNSFYSAIKCSRCPDGWLLPPACFSNESVSRCNACLYPVPSGKIERIEFHFRRILVGDLTKKKYLFTKRHQSNCLDRMISKATSEYHLHPNHNLVFWAMQRWLTTLSLGTLLKSNKESQMLFEKIIERAERCRPIVYRFGNYSDKMELEALISCTLIRYHFKSKDYKKIEKDVDDPVDKLRILMQIEFHLLKGVVLRRYDIFDETTTRLIGTQSRRYAVWKARRRELSETIRRGEPSHCPNLCSNFSLSN